MNGAPIICDSSCVHCGWKKKVMIISLMEYLGDIQLLLCTYRYGILLLFLLLLFFLYISLS